jgi:hypothetical protein
MEVPGSNDKAKCMLFMEVRISWLTLARKLLFVSDVFSSVAIP